VGCRRRHESANPDYVYSFLLTANGLGLGFGMLIAHRVGSYIELRKVTRGFMGWSLVVHGILFAVAGYMPALWIAAIFVLLSRTVIGTQFAVQETIFQRSLPDEIRGRITTLDRGAEITMFSISSYIAGISLTMISAPTLTLVAGLLAGSSGVVWFLRSGKRDFSELDSTAGKAAEAA
jgi:MFS family permease